MAQATAVLEQGADGDVLVSCFNVDLTRKDIRCLVDGEWLNDEVINLTIKQMLAQSAAARKVAAEGDEGEGNNAPPAVYMFNTQFYVILVEREGYKYKEVRRFTKRAKVDIFALDFVLVPLHVRNNHWCLACFDMARKELSYLDSLQGPADNRLENLLCWLRDEHQDKKGAALDTSDWTLLQRNDIPEQNNLVDCGMFMLRNANCLIRGVPLAFTQGDMPDLRKRTVLDLLRGEDV